MTERKVIDSIAFRHAFVYRLSKGAVITMAYRYTVLTVDAEFSFISHVYAVI